MYSSKETLEKTYGAEMVAGLVVSTEALNKAIVQAAELIDTYLKTAGYALPIPILGEDGFDNVIGQISDALTVWNLSSDTDKNRQKWEEDKALWMAVLEKIRTDDLRLNLAKTETVTGAGEAVVKARPRIFTGHPTLPAVDPYTGRRTWP